MKTTITNRLTSACHHVAQWALRPKYACLLAASLQVFSLAPMNAASGDIDTSFGLDGYTPDLNLDTFGRDLEVQSDGKVVLLSSGPSSDMTVSRFLSNGTPDLNFDGDGISIIAFPAGTTVIPRSVKIQTDGSIVACGSINDGGGSRVLIVRLTALGKLDASFGNGGIFEGIFTGRAVGDMAIQADGKIVVAGTLGGNFFLERFTALGTQEFLPGSPTPIFTRTTDFGGTDSAAGMAIQSDGKIVVVGQSQQAGNSFFAVARYTSNGAPDTTFNTTGRVLSDFATSDGAGIAGSLGDGATSVALQTDGKIVVVGRSYKGQANFDYTKLAVARYNAVGTLDGTFGNSGRRTIDTSLRAESLVGVVIQGDGKIAATANGFLGDTVFVVRLNPSGSLDTGFGDLGVATLTGTPFARPPLFETNPQPMIRSAAIALQNRAGFNSIITRILVGGTAGIDVEGLTVTTGIVGALQGPVRKIVATIIGLAEVTPSEANVSVDERLNYAYKWTVPDPQSWRDLKGLQLRIRDDKETILLVDFDEATETFALVSEKNGAAKKRYSGGLRNGLQTPQATLHLEDTYVRADGPTSPVVTLHLSVSFKPQAAGRTFDVEVAATDDQGNSAPFENAGTLTVNGKK